MRSLLEGELESRLQYSEAEHLIVPLLHEEGKQGDRESERLLRG